MELFQLEQFMTIAEKKTMGNAAEELFLSRAALSQNLKRLEQELDCQLFTRDRNRLTITPYGDILYQHASNIMDEVKAAKIEIEKQKLATSHSLRVGHFATTLCYLKMPHLAHEHSNYSFEVEIADEARLCEMLQDGELDFAIVSSRASLSDNIRSIAIEQEHALLSVPINSSLYEKESIRLADIEHERFFIVTDLIGSTTWYEEMFASTSVPQSNATRIGSDEYLVEMSENDLVHFTTDQMVGFMGLGNQRKSVAIEDDIACRTIIAAYPADREELIGDILSYLRKHSNELANTYGIFPYLVFPGSVPNLSFSQTQLDR